jgi:hypothetical protein
MLAMSMVGAAPAHRGGAALTRGDEGEAQRWRLEGGSVVVEINAGGRWARLSTQCGEVMVTPYMMGLRCWANRNRGCREDLGAHI